jgi:hypothetical protein
LQVKYAIEFKPFDKNINVAKDILSQVDKFQSEVVQPSRARRDAYEQERKDAVSSGKFENTASYDMHHLPSGRNTILITMLLPILTGS